MRTCPQLFNVCMVTCIQCSVFILYRAKTGEITESSTQLECIQRRATKYILPDLPYKARLNLLLLMYWLELQDLYFFIKCIKDPPDSFNNIILDYVRFSSNNTRSASSNKLVPNLSQYSSSRHFYFNRTIRLWNKLPASLFSISDSLPSIKFKLYIYFESYFKANVNLDQACTYHFICPCSRHCIPC